MTHATGTRIGRALLASALLLALGAGATACTRPVTPTTKGGGTAADAGTPAKSGSDPTGLVSAIDGFGVKLLKASLPGATGNTVVSPLSVEAALAMTANGATGETRSQMLAALGTSALADGGNAQWAALLRGLASRSKLQQLDVANALWAQQGVAFKKPFVDSDTGYFGARLSTLDLAAPSAPATINDWFAEKTHQMITHVIDQPPAGSVMVLTNAAYFKADWTSPFEAEASHDSDFTLANGTKVQTKMMFDTRAVPYVRGAGFSAVRLDYRGDDSEMAVVLPDQGRSLDSVVGSLDGVALAKLAGELSSAESTSVDLGLPKLDTTFGAVDLKKALVGMGMPRAFDADSAQFDAMADPAQTGGNIFISSVVHKTRLKVDEKGTEAAAATAVTMATNAAQVRVQPPIPFVCDRPYLIALIDKPSGALLFLGAIEDPRAK